MTKLISVLFFLSLSGNSWAASQTEVTGCRMIRDLSIDKETETALLAAYDDALPPPIADARSRARKEKKIGVNPSDGRRMRATGRTVQFNVNMKPEVKTAIGKAAHEAGVSTSTHVWSPSRASL